MSNIASGIIPYTEIVERSMNLARDDSVTSESKFMGLVNDAYTKELFRNEDWDFGKTDTYLTCSAYYNTGTVAVSAASTSLVGTSTVWTSGMTVANGWKIKFSGNDLIYTFAYASATTAAISPALSGDVDISAGGYTLFRDIYSLASDFSRFLLSEEGGLQLYRSGRYVPISVVSDKTWRENYKYDPSDTVSMCRFNGWDSSGYRRLQINPATKKAIMLPYEYMKIFTPMTEYTTGYISAITNASTAVTGSGTSWATESNIDTDTYMYYLRVDADGTGAKSVWYHIASVTNATTIVLTTAYGGTSISSGVSTDTYTISRVPVIPHEFHDWLIYSASYNGIADQGDKNYQYYVLTAKQILSDCRLQYKSRRTSKQYDVVDDYRSYDH